MTDAFSAADKDPVAELVGEDKKFKTVADLAKGKLESDLFIEQLKKETADLRKELGTKVDTEATLAELRNELKALKEKPAVTSPMEKTPSSVSESDLKALIARTITEQEATKTSAQNIVSANNAVVRHYGNLENAQAAIKAKAAELNLTVAELKETAAKSPTAFLKLVLPEADSKATRDFISSSTRSEALPQVTGSEAKEGTKEFYDALRAKNPKLYFSPEVQNKIFKAAMAGTYDYTAGLSRE